MRKDSEKYKIVEDLYEEMHARLYLDAVSSIGDARLAEEAVQDTFRIACMKADDLIESGCRQGWMTNTLKNVIRNIRKCRTKLDRTLAAAMAEYDAAAAPSCDSVEFEIFCTGVVGKEDFEMLKRVAVEKLTLLEVANEFGIPVDTCKKRVQRAKTKLKEAISENF